MGYRTAAEFAQSLRMRRRKLPGRVPLVVVEGTTDQRAFASLFHSDTHIVSSGGRSVALGAYDEMVSDRDGTLFLVDCDADIDPAYKGHRDLVVSVNRDLEADLVIELNALDRIGHEYLGRDGADIAETRRRITSTTNRASELCIQLGLVKDAARELGLRLRHGSGRAPLRPTDLRGAADWLGGGARPHLDGVATASSSLLGWSPDELVKVKSDAEAIANRACRDHSAANCNPCQKRRHINGHDLVDALAGAIAAHGGKRISPRSLDAFVRMTADRSMLPSWDVAIRIRSWESQSGLIVLR